MGLLIQQGQWSRGLLVKWAIAQVRGWGGVDDASEAVVSW
jgi:hypothetical protein